MHKKLDENNPSYFETKEDAQAELDCFIKSCLEDFELGWMPDYIVELNPEIDDYRIVELKEEI